MERGAGCGGVHVEEMRATITESVAGARTGSEAGLVSEEQGSGERAEGSEVVALGASALTRESRVGQASTRDSVHFPGHRTQDMPSPDGPVGGSESNPRWT